MNASTAILFTRNGLGDAPPALREVLAVTFATLLAERDEAPGTLLFYGEGVRLACEGSPVLGQVAALVGRGSDAILCRTCLDYFGLLDRVAVGRVGGMAEIVAALAAAGKVVSV
jgi:hypothetical protein